MAKKIIIHIEGLNAVSDMSESVTQLTNWHKAGLRSIAPWWNIDNIFGGGTNSPTRGLTESGACLVDWIEDNHMVLDLAHASRQTFFDVANRTTRPLYVSHGNADRICPSPRNYTDEQLFAIAESDGVIGVFFPARFSISDGKIGFASDIVKHILYIKNLIGSRHIAIGSDLGGIVTGTLTDLSSVQDIPNLISGLNRAGLSFEIIEAITHKNAVRVLNSHLDTSKS